LTLPEADGGNIESFSKELTIFGIPVYYGRVPPTALGRLKRFKGRNTPAVVVAVYGNREYEDALLELKDLVVDAGFKPLAGGAFIGEHSFSTASLPIAEGRPDNADEDVTKSFGQKIADRMRNQIRSDDISIIDVPGNFPYREMERLGAISPTTREDDCTKCETCASVCPTGAITVAETVETDEKECILCCACVKNCPSGGRIMDHPHIQKATEWLNANFSKRKDPEIFI
jgi:ferredoxin